MSIDYTRLRELAEAATAKPRRYRTHWATAEEATYIAAATPAVVLGLLDRLAELEAGEARTEWRVATADFNDATTADSEETAREILDLWNNCDGPCCPNDARLERRTVTTGAWEVVE